MPQLSVSANLGWDPWFAVAVILGQLSRCAAAITDLFKCRRGLAAEESLSTYCKPVELYNILQRRAIRKYNVPNAILLGRDMGGLLGGELYS
ncbi:hypothetical protein HPP92_008719 [Vanilla planifolia]|uniref:Uncharacterized protein n=1 Tax=Vanilla planifolia TaxID=51239 RepID=A0A835V410_VANPL|nr:hypothetical protein HPP92_008719 [Vanilla planifolia]